MIYLFLESRSKQTLIRLGYSSLLWPHPIFTFGDRHPFALMWLGNSHVRFLLFNRTEQYEKQNLNALLKTPTIVQPLYGTGPNWYANSYTLRSVVYY